MGNIDFATLKGTELNSKAAGNFHAREQVTSAYLRLDQRLGSQLSLMAGLRMEHTNLDYRGYNWVVTDPADENGNWCPRATTRTTTPTGCPACCSNTPR
jgi:outer membrane receptor protein involved in Fe transport